jgi:hypothetical protein
MTNFHSRIMNLPFDRPISSPEYATGHRDARHAAAEIANEADALAVRLAEAERLLREVRAEGDLWAHHETEIDAFLRTTDSADDEPYICRCGKACTPGCGCDTR